MSVATVRWQRMAAEVVLQHCPDHLSSVRTMYRISAEEKAAWTATAKRHCSDPGQVLSETSRARSNNRMP